MKRRTFLATSTSLLLGQDAGKPQVCLFSKHAAQLDYEQLARFCRDTGFDGVDLTVRPGGHVLPGNVARDLPLAYRTLTGAGLSVPMITTGLTDPLAPESRATLRTAGQLKIPFWKIGYWRYPAPNGVTALDAQLADVGQALKGFASLSREFGVTAGMHNHSGNYVGAPVWDTWQMIEPLDPQTIGFYFDPAHATAEGGAWTWNASLELALRRLKMVAVKDFHWEKREGKWRMRWCALGEGMVDWPAVMKRLARARFAGPLTLHVEYENPDELKAVAADAAVLRRLVREAWG